MTHCSIRSTPRRPLIRPSYILVLFGLTCVVNVFHEGNCDLQQQIKNLETYPGMAWIYGDIITSSQYKAYCNNIHLRECAISDINDFFREGRNQCDWAWMSNGKTAKVSMISNADYVGDKCGGPQDYARGNILVNTSVEDDRISWCCETLNIPSGKDAKDVCTRKKEQCYTRWDGTKFCQQRMQRLCTDAELIAEYGNIGTNSPVGMVDIGYGMIKAARSMMGTTQQRYKVDNKEYGIYVNTVFYYGEIEYSTTSSKAFCCLDFCRPDGYPCQWNKHCCSWNCGRNSKCQ
eukprot:318895_1